jgi:glycyl-tRNA synthetase beta chain
MSANNGNTHAPLLVELGTEELPPKALPELAEAFFNGLCEGLDKRGIGFERTGSRPLYTPRRLAALLENVELQQPARKHEVLGPYLNIGLDASGQPTPALLGFAGKNGVEVSALERATDAKGERFVARSEKPGAATAALLPEIVAEALKALPIPKPMRWGDRDTSFVRPVHWLLMMLGSDVVEGEVLGLRADRMSRGHRFHHNKPVWISQPGDYLDALREAHVLADPVERLAKVRSEIDAAAARADGSARVSQALVEEVACLVEWPRAILCGFEAEFLRVPHEALVSTMEANQKFFPVLSAEHRLTEHFIGIANIESKDEAEVRRGYERVIRPRFADARFFYDEDLKQGLESMRQGLSSVTYQQKLGSYADKGARVSELAGAAAALVGADVQQARRAAELSKADLQSRMVGEFPELQGIMGRYYASATGEAGAVADAIDHAYMPRFAGDAIAPNTLSQVLAVAERLDNLASGFGAGLKPSGNKDPFALRRNALGLARTLIEGELELPLKPMLAHASGLVAKAMDKGKTGEAQAHADAALVDELHGFVLERLRGYYADQGVSGLAFDAVAASAGGDDATLIDFDRRLKAIAEFAGLPEAPALAAANKRIRNILRKSEDAIPDSVSAELLAEDAERRLAIEVESAIRETQDGLAERDYVSVLRRLAALREPVDGFFDHVMVMADDPALRRNRLALLKRLADRFAAVAAVEHLSQG